jgi:hypothetical protein
VQKLGGRGGKRSGLEALGQSVNLLGVENGIAFEEGDFAFDVFAFFVGLGLGETVGIDNEGTGFTFADLAAKFLGLLVGHPEGRGKTFVGGRTPKQKNVHAFVGGSVVAEGARDEVARLLSTPGLEPGADTLGEVGDNSLSDAGINIGRGGLVAGFWFHGLSPLGLRGHALRMPPTPVGETGGSKRQGQKAEEAWGYRPIWRRQALYPCLARGAGPLEGFSPVMKAKP